MQDNLPDLPRVNESSPVETSVDTPKPSLFKRLKGIGSDDKRTVKLILIAGFVFLVVLGVVASILEQVAPRGVRTAKEGDQNSSGLWQLEPQPNQILLGFYIDKNANNVYDYQETIANQVSVAIRRQGETEPFRRVPAGSDGWAKIDDLSLGTYEISLDNYYEPVSSGDEETPIEWLWFDDYQKDKEFLPTAWREIKLEGKGYKELIGITKYQPSLILALATEDGVAWYDPDRARIIGKNNVAIGTAFTRGKDLFYIQADKLKHLDWTNRTVIEQLNWLDEVKDWTLSPEGKTVVYVSEDQLRWRSAEEACPEGGLLFDGMRLKVKSFTFIGETSWLVVARTEEEKPWQLFRAECTKVEPLESAAEPTSVLSLAGGDWFYASADNSYFYDNAAQKTTRYQALGNGAGVSVSQDKRYLVKKVSGNSWLVVDYPGVKSSGVEKHYLLTGFDSEPATFGDDVYFVKAKACEADGDCGEVGRIKLDISGVWSLDSTWDLKDVPATRVLGVVESVTK
jgi:hypothetical protein